LFHFCKISKQRKLKSYMDFMILFDSKKNFLISFEPVFSQGIFEKGI